MIDKKFMPRVGGALALPYYNGIGNLTPSERGGRNQQVASISNYTFFQFKIMTTGDPMDTLEVIETLKFTNSWLALTSYHVIIKI